MLALARRAAVRPALTLTPLVSPTARRTGGSAAPRVAALVCPSGGRSSSRSSSSDAADGGGGGGGGGGASPPTPMEVEKHLGTLQRAVRKCYSAGEYSDALEGARALRAECEQVCVR